MGTHWPQNGPNHAPLYIISGIPYITQSAAEEVPDVSGATLKHEFPYATKFFEITNIDSTHVLRVGFTDLGVKGTVSSHYFTLAAGATSEIYYLRCKELYFGGESGTSGFKIVAGLTDIPSKNFPALTGSITGSAVGSGLAVYPINSGVG